MTENFLNTLFSLSLTFGPTGCEKRVAERIEEELKGICRCTYDRMGNLICHLPGHGEKLMIAAGMDEMGFMITDIDDKGYIRVAPTGSADPACFLGKEFTVGNESTLTEGVGAGKVLHLVDRAGDSPTFDKLFIDVGAKTKEDAEKFAEKGDFAAYRGELFELPGDCVAGKALESRSGCAIVVEALKEAAKRDESERKDLYAVFTVKEKANMSGAVTAAYNLCPDNAILLGFTPSMNFDGDSANGRKRSVIPGEGVVLPLKDGSVLFYDSPFLTRAKEKAEELEIPFVLWDSPVSLSAGRAHLVKEGLPMIELSIPCYNPETPLAVVHKKDIDSALKLLTALM